MRCLARARSSVKRREEIHGRDLRRHRYSKKRKTKALAFVAKSGRNLEPAKIEYLYKLYIADVIAARPHLKIEGIELGIQMAGLMTPSARALKAQELVDAALVPELEKEGRCNF